MADKEKDNTTPQYDVGQLLGGLVIVPEVRMKELSSVKLLPGRLRIRHTDGSRVDVDPTAMGFY